MSSIAALAWLACGLTVGLALGERARRMHIARADAYRDELIKAGDALLAAAAGAARTEAVFTLGREAVQAVQTWWAIRGSNDREDAFLTAELTRIRDQVERLTR